MARKLPTDCLNEILEYLEEDKTSLHSCLLVNRHWCEVAVRILWRNLWNFQYHVYYPYRTCLLPSTVLNTLIACLSNESKGLLHMNGIFISTPTSKPPLFDYMSFIKVLPVDMINKIIVYFLIKNQVNFSYAHLILQELLKTLMDQISSLKTLKCSVECQNIPFINFPGAEDCLIDLSALNCHSNM